MTSPPYLMARATSIVDQENTGDRGVEIRTREHERSWPWSGARLRHLEAEEITDSSEISCSDEGEDCCTTELHRELQLETWSLISESGDIAFELDLSPVDPAPEQDSDCD
ncbi:hypothetical protein G6O69_05020 [Pseudenhygromyxa sp. WMMC2535]|uniref:hypothetical protein n=1 Tax=Pseudenhygromyxa sp. WMMC2535 TaxID=2712867 RepID=UPI001554207D|nr:hypothetical protein [Pseudenhygromyxa sp. WMMC2535]NVB37182.1 hypothetical protein [Pseudenhygromyxa sp. WMMC2535]